MHDNKFWLDGTVNMLKHIPMNKMQFRLNPDMPVT